MDETKKTILITGTTGFVGNCLYRHLQKNDQHKIVGTSRHSGTTVDIVADISRFSDVKKIKDFVSPDIIIHTAGISKTDFCEKNPELCYSANVSSTEHLHDLFPKTHFIFFSTYAVYNNSLGNCDEHCQISPTNYYIKTKIACEDILMNHSECTIVRPSVIFGYTDFERDSKNYFMQLLDNIEKKNVTKTPVDQYFNPVFSGVIAEIVERMIHANLTGIYNIGANESCSKYQFNRMIMERFGFEDKYLQGIDSRTLDTVRPQNGTIFSRKIQEDLQYTIPSLKKMIEMLYISATQSRKF
jgi:dTDP-4-dehydrorhamnose reductase